MNEDDSDAASRLATMALPELSRSLFVGSSGSDVMAMQKVLLQLGYSVIGSADGEFGPKTKAAIMAFQKDHGIEQDGVVGNITWSALSKLTGVSSSSSEYERNGDITLSSRRVLLMGSSGNDVAELQKALNALGYEIGSADGVFGPITKNAVLAFQKSYNLDTDGAVGKLTIAEMNKALKALTGAGADSTPGSAVIEITADVENDADQDGASRDGSIVSRELSGGMQGSDVKALQQELIRLGYMQVGTDDGRYGNLTIAAVKEFQSANGAITPNGKVDQWTIDKLDGSPVAKSEIAYNKVIKTASGDYNFTRNMELDMEGDDIDLVQERLSALGYLAATPAGYFGNMTDEALMAFQKNAGLEQTGVVDVNTLNKLFNSDAPKSTAPQSYTASSLVDSVNITDKNYDREDNTIKYIIPHHMAGRMSGENCATYFVNNGLENSANYCIGYNGDIALGVPEDYGAWTSSWWAADEQGITIEVSDTSVDDWSIPEKAQDALVDLCVDLIKRNPSIGNKMIYDESDKEVVLAARKAKDPSMLSQLKGNVLLHNWTSGGTTTCPGEGMLEILPTIVQRVNERLK